MKITIEKRAQEVIDTARERARINKAFRNDPETKEKLNLLMDAVEAGKWKEAMAMLESKWWQGDDKKQECPRLEFVGMLFSSDNVPRHFSFHSSYIDLITWFAECPENYTVVKAEKS